ncbi:hypothetical protein [Zooshikella harenae]|uniref:Uncharacterized protein n=1 Tax=Zooshikella harenae TaxID=2827238 RepID=A0ABS5Z724_9GAMM|nr:hypothetical protein [Zooshikella harenae]MBU2709850.1 hypothetical protein [Zooshikella harenae]
MRFKPLDIRPFGERLKEDPDYDITQDRYWEADQTMSIYGDPELGTSVWDDVRSMEVKDLGVPLLPYVIREKTPPILDRVVPPVPEPDTSPDLSYKIVVEVAGIKHNGSQRLYLDADRQNELSVDLKAAETCRKEGEQYRSLVAFNNIPNISRTMGIRIAMHGRGEPPLLLPLGQIQPVSDTTEKTPWDNIIIPVKPLGYITEKKTRPESDVLQEGGWVYVFWKNKLWRELQVGKNQTYRDTRLDFYRRTRNSRLAPSSSSEREPLGTEYDTIWLPFKINGEVQQGNNGIKMLFSKRQLSWTQIDKLEGNSTELDKQATTVDAVAVYDSLKGFDLDDGPVGPIAPALLDQNTDVAPPPQNPRVSSAAQYLDRNRQHKIPVVYLDNVPYVYLKLQLLDDDGELLMNMSYTIKLESSFLFDQQNVKYLKNAPALRQWESSGNTDAEGILEVKVPAIAKFAVIYYTPEGESEPLSSLIKIGVLAPEDTIEGQKGALNNLSIHSGFIDQQVDECYQAAVDDFKAATGASDQEWLQKITDKKQYC